ncbi:MAG: sugar phosphate isomerase/epimerase [Bryobacteraceae bacterium]|nr:sugar phosphate isomerase/epimerase [Bryobacteraceae bacterium]
MRTISRRDLLRANAAGFAALSTRARELEAAPLGLPIGCQVYPVREALSKDFDGTLRELAAIGYQTIEMCSPPGYLDSGFGGLVNVKASELRARIRAAGMGCESSHYQFRELKEHLDERIAYAKELGLKQMIVSTFALPRDATMADWVRAAGELNKIGERTKKAGLQAGFHNHQFEFREIDGALIYDKLLSEFDPDLVKMQFQVSVISLGHEAATYFEKHPGRFISIHLQDWSPADKKMVAVGQGVVDWKKLFGAAKKGGVKNYFVELNLEAMKASYAYLRGLKA